MPREFSLLDALVPTLFLAFLVSVVLQAILDRIMGRIAIYRHVWHPPLFRAALFICIFCSCGLLVLR